ncbi:MAG TPA: hypothetical protein VN193_16585 [Candidatus Angelobacter sp.]|jgi:hypothetical protein|nr:hypothetical protein [Candidatus Angelobacter sp.]
MTAAIAHLIADLDPGDAGWGDVLFVSIWALGSLLLGAYYCYRAFLAR